MMSQWTMTVSLFVIPQAFLNGCGHGACGAHSTWSPGMHPLSTSISCRQSSCSVPAPGPPSSHRRNNNPLQNLSTTEVYVNLPLPDSEQNQGIDSGMIHIEIKAMYDGNIEVSRKRNLQNVTTLKPKEPEELFISFKIHDFGKILATAGT